MKIAFAPRKQTSIGITKNQFFLGNSLSLQRTEILCVYMTCVYKTRSRAQVTTNCSKNWLEFCKSSTFMVDF